MDLWAIARKPLLGIPPPNYGLVGRWLAHMPRGHFRHDAIAAARPVPGERLIGWTAHYFIGIALAAILLGLWGVAWIRHPTIGPALLVGVGSVAAPFLVMQPGMGAGIAARRTPLPPPGFRASSRTPFSVSASMRPAGPSASVTRREGRLPQQHGLARLWPFLKTR